MSLTRRFAIMDHGGPEGGLEFNTFYSWYQCQAEMRFGSATDLGLLVSIVGIEHTALLLEFMIRIECNKTSLCCISLSNLVDQDSDVFREDCIACPIRWLTSAC